MRDISPSLAARIDSGTTTLAHVWRVQRRDGDVFGFTDHDQTLVFDELICAPNVGLIEGAIEKGLGLGVDTASMSGALASEAIREADLAAGVWDGARVDLFCVDWTDPDLRVHLFAGRIGEVRRGAQAFEAELRGLQAPLNVPVGRVFSRFCDADLGDARCTKAISTTVFSAVGGVAELISSVAFRTADLGAYADNWFSRGRLRWESGAETEIATHRIDGDSAIVEVVDPPGDMMSEGATFTIFAGCDKRHETCRAKFDNAVNFRGFPHMPGNDAVQAGPSAGDANDGGSRWL